MTDTATNAPQPADTDAILTVTDTALPVVMEVRSAEDDPANTSLKITVTGSNMTEFTYSLELVPTSEAEDGDAVYAQGDHDELSVIIPADSIESMRGSTLDVPATSASGGLVIRNPNTPNPAADFDGELTGDLASDVQTVLDQLVNPALASHGGSADLVEVTGTTVVVTMGGGCQGCAASAMTLRDGIRTMLMDTIPEITDVLDATDHTAGENPFYT